jgi:hypothetical protein
MYGVMASFLLGRHFFLELDSSLTSVCRGRRLAIVIGAARTQSGELIQLVQFSHDPIGYQISYFSNYLLEWLVIPLNPIDHSRRSSSTSAANRSRSAAIESETVQRQYSRSRASRCSS